MQEKKSQNVKKILFSLKEKLNLTSDIALARQLNVKPNTISNWKKRETLDYKAIIKICAEESLNLNDIFFTNSFLKAKKIGRAILVDKNHIHSYTINNVESLDEFPFFEFPYLESSNNRVFQVNNNDMNPTFNENDYIICSETSFESINPNEIIVCVSQSKGFFINRLIEKSEDHLILKSDNDNLHTQNKTLNVKDINELWEVKGRMICKL